MTSTIDRPARVGVITDQTGALSFMGIANVNVAKMVIDDINSRGGLLGRPVDLFVEDSATDDEVARDAAGRLLAADVDVVVGGIYSSTRQAIKDPVVDEAGKLYIYPEQYEGQESHPLIFCTGPVPAQQVEPFFPWLMEQTGRNEVLHAVGRLHLAAHDEQEGARGRDRSRRRDRRRGSTSRSTTWNTRGSCADIMASGADVVFNTIVPPGLTPFLAQLHDAGFIARGGKLVCTYFDENFLNLVPGEHVEGLYGCLDYYRDVQDPFSRDLLNRYEARYPGSAMFTAGSACTGTYRALKMWESAVNEAGTLHQHDVIAALDHARIPQGPGGPAEMVPGQHHVRMNMYIAQSQGGTFKVLENLGHIDPNEPEVPIG